ncbi:MAG: 5,10-methylenetetrahydrofolate reductase [Desulfobacca sp. 4484_104]|nr:MAG: 5,10-methylenetetrahydrofolate reductase [Desulfobacca sp. 4484_104]RLA88120.1 MAG: methylenetetrahydrofolate reductase [Deltaproteobacteria bacterium]
MKTESKLEKILESGQLAVTSEAGPPRGAEPEVIRKKGEMLKAYVDCCNVTDNQTAMVRVCSLASCIILKQMGLSPILQMTARDRNRLAIQADILGAYAFGINTMLCLTGDHQSFGDHPTAANVFDLDSIQMIQGVNKIRQEGTFMGGAKMTLAPKMFIGAAANPFADPFELRVMRLAKKIAAGVDFIQTQCIFNMDKFGKWMQMICDEGLDQKVHILAGITPMKGLGMARYMKNKVPGMDVPDEVINRLKGVPKEKQADEGITMAVEQIQQLKEMKGVHGFHIMAIEWEEKVPEIVERAGLLPRPKVD